MSKPVKMDMLKATLDKWSGKNGGSRSTRQASGRAANKKDADDRSFLIS